MCNHCYCGQVTWVQGAYAQCCRCGAFGLQVWPPVQHRSVTTHRCLGCGFPNSDPQHTRCPRCPGTAFAEKIPAGWKFRWDTTGHEILEARGR